MNIFAPALLSSLLACSSYAFAENNHSVDLLTGDARLACEATLCLSSGTRPNECAPSIKRYFSINHKKLRDTLNARRNFLKLCPSSKEKGMDDLVEALVHGAGRCDAKELNRVMKRTYQEKVCDGYYGKYGKNCYFITRSYVLNGKPSYCSVYFNHEWTTSADKVRFIGSEKRGGKWMDVK